MKSRGPFLKPGRRTTLLGPILLFIVLAWLATAVHAHPVPFSYVDLRLGPGQLEGALVMHVIDLAHDLDVTPAEALLEPAVAESKKDAILSLLRSRLMVAGDGRPLELELSDIEPLADRQALSLDLRFPGNGSPGVVRIQCALFPYDPEHQTFLNIYEDGALIHQEIFNKEHTSLDYFTGSRQGSIAVVRRFVPGGIYHIFTGP